jgi:hypothetical protein
MRTIIIPLALLSMYAAPLMADTAEPPKNGGDGIGVRVRLEAPWTTIMAGENEPYHFVLENASNKPIPIAIPVRKFGLGSPAGGQAFLEPDMVVDAQHDIHKTTWPPRDAVGNPPEAWSELKPGERITWNQNRLPVDLFTTYPFRTLRAHWLLDQGKWISSETVRYRAFDVYSEREVVFAAEFSSYGYGKDLLKGEAFTVEIDRERFLFWDMTRVAKVGRNDRFAHRIDEHGTNLEITISGEAGIRKRYLHLRHGLVDDKPWPIGPASLFYPKPEPIPPAELASLRSKLGLSPDGAALPKPEAPSPASHPSSSAPDAGPLRHWPWIIAGLIAVAMLLLLVGRFRRR